MATWNDLVSYVKGKYTVAEENDGMLKLIFNTDEGRSQIVFLWKTTLMDGQEEWVQIESPFADASKVDVTKALTSVGEMAVGGVALINGMLFFRHTVPLAGLDVNEEFERPFLLVITSADGLENELGQGDEL